MRLKEDVSEDKLFGRYYTPGAIANYVTEWVLNQNDPVDSLLEPSVGDGIFLESICRYPDVLNKARVIAIEVDKAVSRAAAERCEQIHWVQGWENVAENDRVVVHDDFYKAYRNGLSEQRYRAILGNPPYIRYQYLEDSQRTEQSEILTQNGMASNKLINAWVSFTVASISCMADNSKIGFVIPAELLQVKYSEDLRKFLTRHLNRITIVTFRNLVFDGIEQEVVLLLGEKIGGDENHNIRIVQFDELAQMKSQNLDDYEFFEADLTSSKWTKYFLQDLELEQVQMAERDERFIRFSNVARCEVGITTGNNEYFCVDNNIVQKYGLESFCKPLIARSVNIRGAQFTREDWQTNIEAGARTYLLDLAPYEKERFTRGVKDYIRYGEENEQNTTYKCRIRDEWYKVPSVWAPDAFFLRRNYLYPKFMLNTGEVDAVSTDTMHRIRFVDVINRKRAVVAYYTSIALLFSELEGRSYGGGVLEILPGEVGKILLPNIFDEEIVPDDEIERLFDMTDQYIRNNNDIIELLETIDREILINRLGITEDEVMIYRSAWISLRNRRLVRGGREASDLEFQ
ncbi:MAG: class I SAM-dependent methyltransferase [Lachnospiraceae bacterium]|nr:class I SAM-dependent methyltransferase [Lachnospiraceae bacterium]